MEKKIFKVKKVEGFSTYLELKNGFSKIEGFKDVKVDITTKQIRVLWDAPATWNDFELELTRMGYQPVFLD